MLSEADRKDEVVHFLKVVQAFKQYEAYAISANTRRRRDFRRLPLEDQKLLNEVGWKSRLDTVDDLIAENAKVLNRIVANPAIFMDEDELAIAEDDLAEGGVDHTSQDHIHDGHNHSGNAPHDHSHSHPHSHGASHGAASRQEVSSGDQEKIRSTLKQFVRDWSEEGRAERNVCYKPMIDALLKRYPSEEERAQTRVLIPGAGLARLGWEIAFLGFESQCNEFSHFMLLPSYYVLNEQVISTINQHTIYPYIHSFSNATSPQSLLRGVSFPDILPSSLPAGSKFSMVAGDFEEIFGVHEDLEKDEREQWNAVLTCFFIDTAKNVINYLRTIHRILAPGGVWINCGPLLWHFENSEELSIELSMEEVKGLARKIGFVIEDERTVNTSYVGDEQSMLGHVYRAGYWTATKGA